MSTGRPQVPSRWQATIAIVLGCMLYLPVWGQPQKDWSDAVLYFVILDRYADDDPGNDSGIERRNPGGWHGGDFAGLTAHLDEIAALGVTALWITPVVKQIDRCLMAQAPPQTGIGSFQHCGFHGYWADDFTALDPHFGTEAQFKQLVEAAHARGLKVLLDVVYNHVGYDSHYLRDSVMRGWIRTKEVSCDADPLICQVGGLPDLRTEMPEVQNYLLDAHLGLARRIGLDGFRLDTVKHVGHEFWRRHRLESRNRLNNDFFLLGEVWGGSAQVLDEYFADDELDAGFDFTFRGECRAFVEGRGRTVAYASYLEKRHRVRAGYHLAHYLSSHDEPMLLYELNGDKDAFRLCVALQMTSLGIPTIFYGEEVARSGSVWPLNRTDMPWGSGGDEPGSGLPRDEAMLQWYRQLIAIRHAHPALRDGAFRRLSTDGDLLVFAREQTDGDDIAIVVVNRGRAPATAVVPLPSQWKGKMGKDALTGAAAVPSEAAIDQAPNIKVDAPARGVRIYVGG